MYGLSRVCQYIVLVLHCIGNTMYGNTTRGYYIVWEVWIIIIFYPDKTRQTMLFRRLGALCGVLGGAVVMVLRRGVEAVVERLERFG